MVVASAVVGGYMVETAQAISGSGRLTAIRELVQRTLRHHPRPLRRLPGQHRLRLDGCILRRDHVPAGPVTILSCASGGRSSRPQELLDNAARQLGKIGAAGTSGRRPA